MISRANTIRLLFVVLTVFIAVSISNKDDSIPMQPNQKELLAKLKRIALPKIPQSSLVHKFAQDDLYLLRWLQASKMDVHEAKEKIIRHLKWRQTENVDTIDTEDWTDAFNEFPLLFGGNDKEGRPIIEKYYNEWNIKQAVNDGRSELVHRIMVLQCELLTRQLYEAREAGKNVTGAIILNDMEGFSFLKQVCPLCVFLFTDLAHMYENNYPGLVHKLYLINVPQPFYLVYRAMLPFMSESTTEKFHFLPNKDEWMTVLDNDIDPSERSSRFGGIMT